MPSMHPHWANASAIELMRRSGVKNGDLVDIVLYEGARWIDPTWILMTPGFNPPATITNQRGEVYRGYFRGISEPGILLEEARMPGAFFYVHEKAVWGFDIDPLPGAYVAAAKPPRANHDGER